MGYRSDIKVVFYAIEAADFPLVKLWVDENIGIEGFDPPTEFISDGRKGLLYEFESVKWYPNFEDVKAFEAAMTKFGEIFDENGKGAYEFVRIGEEDEDIERKSSDNAWGVLRVTRSVEVY